MTDYCIIAEGNVERHVKSLYLALKKVCDTLHTPIYHAEGQLQGDWVVMDCGDLSSTCCPEQREKYNLESLWRPRLSMSKSMFQQKLKVIYKPGV